MVIKIKLFNKSLYYDYANLLSIYLLFLYIYMLRAKATPSIHSLIANYDILFVLFYTILIIVLLNILPKFKKYIFSVKFVFSIFIVYYMLLIYSMYYKTRYIAFSSKIIDLIVMIVMFIIIFSSLAYEYYHITVEKEEKTTLKSLVSLFIIRGLIAVVYPTMMCMFYMYLYFSFIWEDSAWEIKPLSHTQLEQQSSY